MQCVAAFDLGTTAVKGFLLSEEGKIIAEDTIQLHTFFGENGEIEQDPEEWWKVIRSVSDKWFHEEGHNPANVKAVSFSGQMEDVIILNENKPVPRAILYSDTRAEEEADFIHSLFPDLQGMTGNTIAASTPFAKLLWLNRHEPEFSKSACSVVFSAKDYIVYKMTGFFVSDHVTCATTGLMNLETRQWIPGLLEDAGIRHVRLPGLVAPDAYAGCVTEEASRLSGFAEGTPVLCGSGDAGASTIGAGAIREGDCYLYLGTTGWAAVPTADHSFKGPGIFTLAHVVPGLNIAIAPLLNVGNVHRWAMQSFLDEEDYDRFESIVQQSEPGANELLCLPYLYGERSPVVDHEAKGAFWGISPTTRTSDFLRAVLEGISFSLRQTMELLMDAKAGNITIIGGGAKSRSWCQILADISQRDVRVPENSEFLPSLGAAASAFRYLGWTKDYADFVNRFIMKRQAEWFSPNKEHEALYNEAYKRFVRLYPSLKQVYSAQ